MTGPCESCPFIQFSDDGLESACNPLQMPPEQQAQLNAEQLTSALGCVSMRLVEAERRAAIDPLTALDRHDEFNRKLEAVYSHAPRAGEIIVDPDGTVRRPLLAISADGNGFGKINKQYGHDQGDRVLEAIAGPFRNLLLQKDRLAGRRGGDEFVAAAFGLDYPEAADLCAEFTKALAEGQGVETQNGFLIVTLGVAAVYGSDIQTYDQAKALFKTADGFLVASKDATRKAQQRPGIFARALKRGRSLVRAA